MRFVRVQYDGDNRQFKLADREFASELEGGGTYLIADLSPADFIPTADLEVEIATARLD